MWHIPDCKSSVSKGLNHYVLLTFAFVCDKICYVVLSNLPVSAGNKNDRDYRKGNMIVELKRDSHEKQKDAYRTMGEYKPIECHQKEMEPFEFAFYYAKALLKDPSLDKDAAGLFAGNYAVFATVLGQDPQRFKTCSFGETISITPRYVDMKVICDGKLAQVKIGLNDSDMHYFFRIIGDELKYLPCGEKCGVQSTSDGQRAFAPGFIAKKGTPAWPWIALFPEKFAELIEFANILNPDDENPLTGLVGAKDAPVRTLAKQIASKLERARDAWIRDIVASL